MTNRTQCPACLSIFNISDEQFKASSGKVRCGRCRQRFQVEFLSDNDDDQTDSSLEIATELDSSILFDHSSDFEHAPNIDESEAEDKIIDEIDHLISNKILPSDTVEDVKSDIQEAADELWVIDKPLSKGNQLKRTGSTLLLSLCILLFSLVLLYQLWLRQQVNWLEADFINPALNFASKQLNIDIPVRQDLTGIHLVSALVEPHPSRSSTILVKTTLINRANIAQPFPWLQLSLTDKDGRLIARRALNPQDYLHNNNTDNLIPANVQKMVSIESLAFPNHAHGYEVRLLKNK